MKPLAPRLKPVDLSPKQLLLDPNNPRYHGDFADYTFVEPQAIAKKDVQQTALQRMLAPRFEVKNLAESIAEVGYLPLDSLVVVPHGKAKFLVIEGNRRTAALRLLESGVVFSTPEIRRTYRRIPALVLDEPLEDAAIDQWLLQGTRHVSGVMSWGPYQKAQAIKVLREQRGMEDQQAARALGTSVTEVRRLSDSLTAYNYFAHHAKYGKLATPSHFSFFEELVKKPGVREGFGWSKKTRKVVDPVLFDRFIELSIPGAGSTKPKFAKSWDLRTIQPLAQHAEAWQSILDPAQPMEQALITFHLHDRKRLIKESAESLLRQLTQRIDRRQIEEARPQLEALANRIRAVLKGE